MCENVMKNIFKRAHICEANKGGHLSDIQFQNKLVTLKKDLSIKEPLFLISSKIRNK